MSKYLYKALSIGRHTNSFKYTEFKLEALLILWLTGRIFLKRTLEVKLIYKVNYYQ